MSVCEVDLEVLGLLMKDTDSHTITVDTMPWTLWISGGHPDPPNPPADGPRPVWQNSVKARLQRAAELIHYDSTVMESTEPKYLASNLLVSFHPKSSPHDLSALGFERGNRPK